MKIVSYEPQQVGPQVGNQPMSLGGERRQMVSFPERGMAAAGIGVIGKALTDINRRMQEAAEVQEFSSAVVKSSRGLADIHEQISQDPELSNATVDELEQAYSERATELRSDITAEMKEHRSKKAFSQRFDEDDLRSRLKIRDFGRQRFISRSRASTEDELQQLSDNLIRTGDLESITDGQAIIDGKVKAGIFSPEEGGQLAQKFERNAVIGYYERLIENPATAPAAYMELSKEKEPKVLSMVDERTKTALIEKARAAAKQSTNDAYESAVLGELQAKYQGDTMKAVEYLESPNNYKGLTIQGRSKLISFLYATENRKRLMADAQQKSQAEKDRAGIFGSVLQNKLDDAIQQVAGSKSIDSKEKMELFEKIKNYPWKTSQGVYADTVQKIHYGMITEPEQVDNLRGAGLSNEDADKLKNKLTAPHYKEALDYAEKHFKLLYPAKEDLEKHVKYLEFVQQVDDDLTKKNQERFKAKKPPMTNSEAREVVDAYLQEAIEPRKFWFDKTYRPVERWMEGKQPFDLKSEARPQIPSHERMQLNSLMTSTQQEQIADILFEAGYTPNAANITKFYNQNTVNKPNQDQSGQVIKIGKE